jgi:hypothetical protein
MGSVVLGDSSSFRLAGHRISCGGCPIESRRIGSCAVSLVAEVLMIGTCCFVGITVSS